MNPTFSFELFPPKTEKGMQKLQRQQVPLLQELGPEFFSVTYGAGGSTQVQTFATVDWLVSQGIEVAPHLSCIGASREQIGGILDRYRDQGVTRLVALRGDIPSGMGDYGEFRYANELVSFIREHSGEHFHIEVAAYPEFHPQAASAKDDERAFTIKAAAGANSAITQYFYNADAYFAFVDDCTRLGIDIPIVPGIMPITNYQQLSRFSDACGAEIPRWIRKRLESHGDDLDAIRDFGTDVVSTLCQRLLDGGAPGLHFYTMNQAAPTIAIWKNLDLPVPA
ncbi:MAG TPA: methylenetetrahydrofolate reductase [NAD(P)H] [Chromatiaceae bacterium]|nr:methylenetetrahydrofolate reductase [NAD(P)H] [Chromatiaceae bacterium]